MPITSGRKTSASWRYLEILRATTRGFITRKASQSHCEESKNSTQEIWSVGTAVTA
jgi:hypothetical protein